MQSKQQKSNLSSFQSLATGLKQPTQRVKENCHQLISATNSLKKKEINQKILCVQWERGFNMQRRLRIEQLAGLKIGNDSAQYGGLRTRNK